MRVLVTGGSGYLGSAIVRALARDGHVPVVFARRASAAGLPGVAVDGDVRSRSDVLTAARGADAVCHSAALVSIWRRRPADFDDINVGGLQNVVDVCRELATPRIIYTSSFLAYPPAGRREPLSANGYQRTKARAAAVARDAATSGLPIITMVPGVIYGPGPATEANLVSRLVQDHLSGRLPGVIGASKVWSYAFVDDVADGHVQAIVRGRSGEVYHLGGENAPQMRPFEIVREVTGHGLPRRIPFAAAWAVGLVEEARAALTGRMPLLTRGAVEIFRHDWPLDSARSVAELGYRIRPLNEGVRTILESVPRPPERPNARPNR